MVEYAIQTPTLALAPALTDPGPPDVMSLRITRRRVREAPHPCIPECVVILQQNLIKPGHPWRYAWEWATMGLLATAYICNLIAWKDMGPEAEYAVALAQLVVSCLLMTELLVYASLVAEAKTGKKLFQRLGEFWSLSPPSVRPFVRPFVLPSLPPSLRPFVVSSLPLFLPASSLHARFPLLRIPSSPASTSPPPLTPTPGSYEMDIMFNFASMIMASLVVAGALHPKLMWVSPVLLQMRYLRVSRNIRNVCRTFFGVAVSQGDGGGEGGRG